MEPATFIPSSRLSGALQPDQRPCVLDLADVPHPMLVEQRVHQITDCQGPAVRQQIDEPAGEILRHRLERDLVIALDRQLRQ